MGGRGRPFCNSANGGSLNLEDCVEFHDADFALFSGVCTFLLKAARLGHRDAREGTY